MGLVGQEHPALRIGHADHRRQRLDQLAQLALGDGIGIGRAGHAQRQLLAELIGPLGQQLLLLAQGQEVAGAGAELDMVDRTQQEVRGPGFQRLIAVAALLVDRHHHHRHLAAARQRPERPDEIGAVHVRHLVVGNHQIDAVGRQPVERRLRTGEGLDPDPLFNRHRQPRQNIAVGHSVIDDDNAEH